MQGGSDVQVSPCLQGDNCTECCTIGSAGKISLLILRHNNGIIDGLQEFGMTSEGSLEWSLCETSVTTEKVIKQRRLPPQMENLAERIALNSRYERVIICCGKLQTSHNVLFGS